MLKADLRDTESFDDGLSEHLAICVVGPTAVGKSDIAQRIAAHLGTSVISADSMQVYRGMDIGTAKLPQDQRIVDHYGIDLVDPGDPYSAALFQAYSRDVMRNDLSEIGMSVIAGGTGFYVRATMDGYEFAAGEQKGNRTRRKYERYLEKNDARALWELLENIDPRSAQVIHPNNSKRVIRALEMSEHGESYADRVDALKSIPQVVPGIFIGLDMDRDALIRRIDRRVDIMRENGLIDEVADLLDHGFREGITSPQAIGYKEIVASLDGQISMDEAFDRIKMATRRYAKRQRSWFKADDRIRWIDMTDRDEETALAQALEMIEPMIDERHGMNS